MTAKTKEMRKTVQLLSKQEAEKLLAHYFSQAVPFKFDIMSNGKTAFMLKNSSDMIVNRDGSVTWTASELGVGLHSFIQLITGEETKKTVYIPLCLVDPKSRQALSRALISATIDPSDGRYNSQDAEFYVFSPCGNGALIHIKLANLAMQYVSMRLFPSDFALRYASQLCPFCKEFEKRLNQA